MIKKWILVGLQVISVLASMFRPEDCVHLLDTVCCFTPFPLALKNRGVDKWGGWSGSAKE